MNALKHGLDAETLILPGEDEAAYRARLDGWKASVRPRDAEEEAQVEEAVRLSWQLDRADRAQAAMLSDRDRRAAEDAAARPAREAAEAARIGERLLAGPPEVPAPRGLPDDEIAGRTFRAPFHPDDPDHPDRLLRQLEATAAGCRWLLERWSDLRAILADDPGAWWGPEHRIRAVRLMGKDPIDAADDPDIGAVYLCSFLMDPAGPRVYSDQADQMTKSQLGTFVERLRGRRAGKRVPPNREAARAELLARVDERMAVLQAMATTHEERDAAAAEVATAALTFDDSPEGARIRRIQSRLSNRVLRAMGGLMKIQHRTTEKACGVTPAASAPAPGVLAASPVAANASIGLRNEPNGPGAAVRNEPIAAHAVLRNEPNGPGSGWRNEPNAAARGLDPRGRPAEDATKRTQRPPDASASRRDETNPTATRPAVPARPRTDGPDPSWMPSSPVPPLQVQPPRADRKRGVRPPLPRPLSGRPR